MRLTERELYALENDTILYRQSQDWETVARLVDEIRCYQRALRAIAEIPGPHYSRDLKRAVETALNELREVS